MRDFPVFTTDFGVATLVLKEVPYKEVAYIIIQSALQPEELLKECVSFCRAVGAEKIYARGHELVEQYPLHTIIYEMRGEIPVQEELVENIWPVTEETVGKWRELVNQRMREIDNSATLEQKDEQEILSKGGAYFVHRAGEVLGIGWIVEDEVLLLAATQKGMGERVLHTLLSATRLEQLHLDVVSTNERAIRFYERLGLIKIGEKHRWYQVR